MKIFDKFLWKHFCFWLFVPWFLLTVIVFMLGVIELTMGRIQTPDVDIVRDILLERIYDLPTYLSLTMPYAGMIGFLLGFYMLWRNGEFVQLRFLGAEKILLRIALRAGFLFGVVQMLLVVPFAVRFDDSWEKTRRDNAHLSRTLDDGTRLILQTQSYNTTDGRMKDGVRVVVLDKNFNLQSALVGRGGKIESERWHLVSVDLYSRDRAKRHLESKSFVLETDLPALAYALQKSIGVLTVFELPVAIRSAHKNSRAVRPFVVRGLFLLTLPLFYMSFALVAYAVALYLPLRGGASRTIAVSVIVLPCVVQFLSHLAWSQTIADTLPVVLPAIGLPLLLACVAGLAIRTERVFL